MLKIVVNEFGPPETLQAVDVDAPKAADAHVVIRAEAIGVNFADVWTRLGAGGEPPVTLGIEVAGTVDASGSDRFAPGDRVVGAPFYTRGAYAQLVSVPEELVFPVPEDVDYTLAAALPLNYLTAYSGAPDGARRGDRVLVTSAAGGVGLAAVQLSRDAGAEVYATASKPKHDFLAGQGVVGTVDSRSAQLADEVKSLTDGKSTWSSTASATAASGRAWTASARRPCRRLRLRLGSRARTSRWTIRRPRSVAMSLPLLDLFDNSLIHDRRCRRGAARARVVARLLVPGRPGRCRRPARRSRFPAHRGGGRAPLRSGPEERRQGLAGPACLSPSRHGAARRRAGSLRPLSSSWPSASGKGRPCRSPSAPVSRSGRSMVAFRRRRRSSSTSTGNSSRKARVAGSPSSRPSLARPPRREIVREVVRGWSTRSPTTIPLNRMTERWRDNPHRQSERQRPPYEAIFDALGTLSRA